MPLTSNDARLTPTLVLIEDAISIKHPRLLDSLPAIQVVPSFEEATPLQRVAGNPAVYQDSTGTIFLDEGIFFSLDQANQIAILCHEVGEFVCMRFPELMKSVEAVNCDLRADFFACTLGFYKETAAGRRDRDEEFHEALRSFNRPSVFVEKIRRWHQRKLAGLAH